MISSTSASVSVSIHAPTRGATGMDLKELKVKNVSIHAPTRGATVATINPLFPIVLTLHIANLSAILKQQLSYQRAKEKYN